MPQSTTSKRRVVGDTDAAVVARGIAARRRSSLGARNHAVSVLLTARVVAGSGFEGFVEDVQAANSLEIELTPFRECSGPCRPFNLVDVDALLAGARPVENVWMDPAVGRVLVVSELDDAVLGDCPQ
jgi:hypothetical protein